MQKIEAKDLSVPAVSVTIGIAYLVGGIIGDNIGFGIFGLGLMTALAIVLLLVRDRSETVQGLLDRRDERLNAIDLTATAFAGSIMTVAIIVAFVVDVANGGDGMPFAWLAAIGGVAYVGSIVVQRLRG